MTASEALRVAAEQGCDLHFDAPRQVWVINKIAVEADTVELSPERLASLSAEQLIDDHLPQPL